MISLDKARSYSLTVSLLIVGAGVLAWFYITSSGGEALKGAHSGSLQVINFQTLKPKPDGYMVCTANACLDGAMNAQAKNYPVSRSKLSQALFNYTDNNPNIKTFRTDLKAWQFDLTENIPSEKFPHVITVQFISLSPSQSSLNIYSRSELTSSNAELHKERVERWLRFMEFSISG